LQCVAVCCSVLQCVAVREHSGNVGLLRGNQSSLLPSCAASSRSGGGILHNLQHSATHCNTVQHSTTHGNTRQHTATHCDNCPRSVDSTVLQCFIAARCSVLQCVALCCSVLLCAAVCCRRVLKKKTSNSGKDVG